MTQVLSVWPAALCVGTLAAVICSVVFDQLAGHASVIGAGLSMGLAVGAGHLWATSARKRQTLRAWEQAAKTP